MSKAEKCVVCGIMKTPDICCALAECPWRPVEVHENIADLVNHPPHYLAHPSGVECIQITRHMNFNLGNAIKYIWRCGSKGAEIEDLKKARWYLDDEIKRLEGT